VRAGIDAVNDLSNLFPQCNRLKPAVLQHLISIRHFVHRKPRLLNDAREPLAPSVQKLRGEFNGKFTRINSVDASTEPLFRADAETGRAATMMRTDLVSPTKLLAPKAA